MTEAQAAATRFCARVLGPVLLIFGAVIIARFDALTLMIPAILQNSAQSFVVGMFTLILGMVLFVAHHHWSSATAILVSLIGLLTIVRGTLLMLIPNLAADFATTALSAGAAPWIAGGVAMLAGVWLTYYGLFAK
jgi:uncharacterized protein YjeT (DUF2065 family)